METTRSRRFSKAASRSAMKSCGPFRASTAAAWLIEEGLEVVWLIILPMALISGFRARRIADAPAGHGVGFRHPVHGQSALVELRLDLGDGGELEPVVKQMLVHIVGQHPDLRVAQQHVRQGAQVRPRVGRAGGVGGRSSG